MTTQPTDRELMDDATRLTWIAEASTGRERISRGFYTPDFFAALGWTWHDHQLPLARAGFIESEGGSKTTYEHRDPYTQLARGQQLGPQVKCFTSRTGRKVRYTVTVQPDGSLLWEARRSSSARWADWAVRPFASGTDLGSLVAHAQANPRPLCKDYKRIYS